MFIPDQDNKTQLASVPGRRQIGAWPTHDRSPQTSIFSPPPTGPEQPSKPPACPSHSPPPLPCPDPAYPVAEHRHSLGSTMLRLSMKSLVSPDRAFPSPSCCRWWWCQVGRARGRVMASSHVDGWLDGLGSRLARRKKKHCISTWLISDPAAAHSRNPRARPHLTPSPALSLEMPCIGRNPIPPFAKCARTRTRYHKTASPGITTTTTAAAAAASSQASSAGSATRCTRRVPPGGITRELPFRVNKATPYPTQLTPHASPKVW